MTSLRWRTLAALAAVAVALAMREGADNDLIDRLAADARLGLDRGAIDAAIANPLDLVGLAPSQVHAFVAAVELVAAADPEAAAYRPGDIL